MDGVDSILVTNDDGIDSPALGPLAAALDDVGAVTVVVPDGERSWSGKSMTRTADVHAADVTRDGRAVTTVTGTPADAAQVGCALLDPGPDLVVSGINVGHNHGRAFAMSSGTIGAAAEAVLLGRRAVAVSTGSMDDWEAWRQAATHADARVSWERLAAVTHDVVAAVLDAGLDRTCDLVSVNLPWAADASTPWRLTRLAPTRYGPMLARDGDDGRWAATYGGLEVLDVEAGVAAELPSDLDVAHRGMVSITPLRLASTAAVTADLRARLDRR